MVGLGVMDIGDIRATVGLLIDGDISGDPATVSVGLAIPGLDTRGDTTPRTAGDVKLTAPTPTPAAPTAGLTRAGAPW